MGKFLPTLNMENDSLESLSAFLEEPIFLLEEDQKSIAAALQVSVGSEIAPAEVRNTSISSIENF